MNKKYVILDILHVILVFLCFFLLDIDSINDFLETDPDTFADVVWFGAFSLLLFYLLLNLVYDTFLLIFRKVRKSLEKQGKE